MRLPKFMRNFFPFWAIASIIAVIVLVAIAVAVVTSKENARTGQYIHVGRTAN